MPAFPSPIEKHMSLSDVKQQFSRIVNEVSRGESTVIIEKHRRPAVAMVSYSDYQNFLRREEVRTSRTNERP